MTAMHILTTALAPSASQAAAPADENIDAGPFTAMLGEQMQAAAHAPAGVLPEDITERLAKRPASDDATTPAPDAALLPGALMVDARREELPTRLSGGTTIARAEVGVTAQDGRNARQAARGLPTAANAASVANAATVAADTTQALPSAATRTGAPFDLAAATQAEAPATTAVTHGVSAPHATDRPAAAAPVHTLQQPVGSERWTNELGQTVQLIVRAEQQSATLHVTPADLGPIEVQIDLSGEQASLSFSAQNADTRSALENAMPRLREMLAEAGIALGDAHVNQQSGEQRETAGQSSQHGDRHAGADASTAIPVSVQMRVGLVDTFA